MNEITRLMQAGGYAFEGLAYLLKEQKNTRLLVVIAILALIICPLLGFSVMQTAIVFLATVMTLVAEVLNTAIEVGLDLQTGGKYHEKVKIAKDVAAASVLICIITSIILFFVFLFTNMMSR